MIQLIDAFAQGFATGAGLIIAIGTQNAFVLKQGILRNHVLLMALLCSLIDALLITLGVGGFGTLIASNTILLWIAKWGGAAFLIYYGFRSFRAMMHAEALALDTSIRRPSRHTMIMTLLAISFLNPHVYLDTVVLLGSISAQFPGMGRLAYGGGAVFASFVWFLSLAYGARYLAPLFQKPLAWKILEFLIGCIMWTIAAILLISENLELPSTGSLNPAPPPLSPPSS